MHSTKTLKRKIDAETPDSALIGMVVEGHEPALNELMRRYRSKLFEFIARYVKDSDFAYDILQETFIRVYYKASTYNPNYRFSTWLYQIAINLCRDWSRKNRVNQWLLFDSSSIDASFVPSHREILSSADNNIENIVDLNRQLKSVEREINKLPHRLKTVLILYAVEGYSQERCAELLDVTIKTIETRVYRARKILAKKMNHSF